MGNAQIEVTLISVGLPLHPNSMIWSRRTRLCKQETNLTGSRCRLRSTFQNVVQTFFQIWSTFAPLQLRERKKKLAAGETELVAYVDASRRTVTDTMGQKVGSWCQHRLYCLLRIFEETFWSTGHEWRMKHWRRETIWYLKKTIWYQSKLEFAKNRSVGKHHLYSTLD